MEQEINKLLATIKQEYINFWMRGNREFWRDGLKGYALESVNNFDKTTEVKYGKKYIKIIRDRSVWGFIVNTDNDKLFKKGDILKAAGWNAPARNAARGNLFEQYSVDWTGPHYLK
jgi:hypothetical protein